MCSSCCRFFTVPSKRSNRRVSCRQRVLSAPSSSACLCPFHSNCAKVWRPPTNGFEHFGVRAHLKGEYLARPLSGRDANAPAAMGSRWRFVLYNPFCQRRRPEVAARGQRMPSARGALPGYATEISRQPRVPHRTAARRLLGASLRLEKRTSHKLFGRTHNDLFTSN